MVLLSNFLRKMMSLLIVAMLFFSVVLSERAHAQPFDVSEAELFGVKLKDANRESLRKACLAAGMEKPVFIKQLPENSEVSMDIYKVNGQLDNAETFFTLFDRRTDEFRSAVYEFAHNTSISQVIDMVSTKYGEPGVLVMDEDVNLPAVAWWPEEMADLRISVERGFGKVTLHYINFATIRKQSNRKSVDSSEELKERAKSQSNAF